MNILSLAFCLVEAFFRFAQWNKNRINLLGESITHARVEQENCGGRWGEWEYVDAFVKEREKDEKQSFACDMLKWELHRMRSRFLSAGKIYKSQGIENIEALWR